MSPELGEIIDSLLDAAAQRAYPDGGIVEAQAFQTAEEAFFAALNLTGLASVNLTERELRDMFAGERGKTERQRLEILEQVFEVGKDKQLLYPYSNTTIAELVFFSKKPAEDERELRLAANRVGVAKNHFALKLWQAAGKINADDPGSVELRLVTQQIDRGLPRTRRGQQWAALYHELEQNFGQLPLSKFRDLFISR